MMQAMEWILNDIGIFFALETTFFKTYLKQIGCAGPQVRLPVNIIIITKGKKEQQSNKNEYNQNAILSDGNYSLQDEGMRPY